jgi:hypothetical protein
MPRPVTPRQVEVLRWISEGCPPGRWPDESHKTSARALAGRGLAKVSGPKSAGGWSATLTDAGRHYLAHGGYPPPPPPENECGTSIPAGRPDPAVRAADDMQTRLQQAISRAVPYRDVLPRQRRALARRAARLRPFVKDIPMRYTFVISRVQTATRHVRAASEEEARKKVEDELARPCGLIGAWETTGQDLDLVAVESPLGDKPLPDHAALQDGRGFMLSVKATAQFLGLAEHTVQKLTRLNS